MKKILEALTRVDLNEKAPWSLIGVFVFLSLGIALAGILYFNQQKDQIKKNKREELAAIADLKVRHITSWRKERLSDTRMALENTEMARKIHQWFSGSRAKPLQQEILSWMASFKSHYEYQSIVLLDAAGTIRLSLSEEEEKVGPDAQSLSRHTMASGRAIFSNLYRSKATGRIRLSLLVPILAPQEAGRKAVGALLMRIDPQNFFYPFIQSWPTTGKTAETLLFSREGNDWILLNESRQPPTPRFAALIPKNDPQRKMLNSVGPGGGMVEGLDTHRIPVLAAIRQIPDSPWYLMAKVSLDEVYAPVREKAQQSGLVVIVMILAAAVTLGLVWRHQRSRFYRQLFQVELEKRTLALHYDYLSKYANDIIILFDQDWRIIEANDQALKAYGYPREELLKKQVWELRAPEYRSSFEEEMARLTLESGKVYEIVQQSQDGRTFPVEASTRLIEIEGRQLFQSIVRNITRRKEAEASLSESEKRYRLLVENAPVGIYTLAADTGYFTTLNPAFEKITGWSCSEWLGKPFIPLVHPEDLPQAMNRFRRVLDGEEVLPYEIRIASKKGDYLIIEIFNTPQMEKGQVVGVVGIGRDVTDRKRTEEALAAEKELLSVTLRSIGDGVISTDIESRIVLINKVAEELTGWHQEEVMGKPLSEVFHIVNEKTRQSRQNPVEKVVQTGSIVTLANGTRLIARNGRERIIEDSGAPIRDREGRIRGVVLVFRDITEKQKIEEELFKAEKLDSIGLLAGGIAHDFNNLLTAILGNLSLAKSSVSPEDRIVKRLIEAEKATLRAKDLTQQLLTFAKGGEPIKQTASLPELIIETANFALRGAKVKCRFSFPENLWKAEIDVGQISQVIHNLILNADQAMPEGGAVLIRVENVQIENDPSLETGNYIRISIQDQGKGIPEEILPKIYDPYFTTKPEGSGLGLATAYSIIHRHEGAIQAVTKEGTGTIFDILLPATQNVANKSVLVKSRGGSPILGKGRILVMDDEAIVGAVVGEMLDYLGYSFELVRDGWEAIKKYESALAAGDPFQAVLLDLTVPGGLGGKEALQSLLAIDPDVRAIVSSGYSSDPVLSEFKKYGFQGMVAKPFRTEDLSQTLSQILSLTPRTT